MNGENVIREWNKMSCPKAALVVRTDRDRWEQIDNLFLFDKFCDVKECFLFTEENGYWNMLYFDGMGEQHPDYSGKDGFRMEVIDNHLCGSYGIGKTNKCTLRFDTLLNSFQDIYYIKDKTAEM